MQIFISEFLTCGAFRGQVSESLLNEGRAMLIAFAADASRLNGVDVVTTWDRRLDTFPLTDVNAIVMDSSEHELETFTRLSKNSDLTFVIAPETDDLLSQRFDLVAAAGGKWNGAARNVIQTCTDKLATAQRLTAASVPVIPTTMAKHAADQTAFERVMKPFDGAGAEETYLVAGGKSLRQVPLSRPIEHYIVQPFIRGTHLSCFCVVNDKSVDVFPTAQQNISQSETLKYLGGEMPVQFDLTRLAIDTIAAVGATTGHFGIDVVVPDNGSGPVVVEINPRLTTSYLGYRELFAENVAERILFPSRFHRAESPDPTVPLFDKSITFTTNGEVIVSSGTTRNSRVSK